MKKFNVTFKKVLADKKSINIQVGRAYENENGNIDLILNAIPLNWEGKLRLWLNSTDDNDDVTEDEDQ